MKNKSTNNPEISVSAVRPRGTVTVLGNLRVFLFQERG